MYRKRTKKTATKPERKKQKTIEDSTEVGEETPRAKRAAAREAKATAEAAGAAREAIAQPPCLALVPVAASMEAAPPCQRFVATIDLTKNHKYKSNYLFSVGGWTWRNQWDWR